MAVILPDWRLAAGGFDTAGSSAPRPIEEVPIGPKDGVNKVFRTTYVPWLGFLQLFVNGDHNSKFVPRFSLTGNVITFAVAPQPVDELYCWYFLGPAATTAGRARHFLSTNLLDWGSVPDLKIAGDITIALWVKTDGLSTDSTLVYQGNDVDSTPGANDLYVLYLHPDGSGKADVGWEHEHGSGTVVGAGPITTGLLPGTWYFLVAIRQVGPMSITVYLGTETLPVAFVGSASPYAANASGGTDPSTHMTVGNVYPTSDHPANSAIQQGYIWDRALTLAELEAARVGNPSVTNLQISWPMGTDPEIDTSGNGSVGTVTGTTLVKGHK